MEGAAAEGTRFNAAQNSQSGAPINVPFSSEAAVAAEDDPEISGVVRLEMRGNNMQKVELLPANGYQPKHGVFKISKDKSITWLDLDTTKLSNGPIKVTISAFEVLAEQSGAQEIIAMPARRWNIDNPTKQGSEPFTASVAYAPADGATASGIVRLEIRGNGIANAELLPPPATRRVLACLMSRPIRRMYGWISIRLLCRTAKDQCASVPSMSRKASPVP